MRLKDETLAAKSSLPITVKTSRKCRLKMPSRCKSARGRRAFRSSRTVTCGDQSAGAPLAGRETWPPLLRVATKYPRTTASWFEDHGQSVEVVRLHGSVELAPQVGLVDGIVDLTASGRTLRENKLRVAAVLGASTARLIANQASLKTRTDAVQSMVARLREAADRPATSRAAS